MINIATESKMSRAVPVVGIKKKFIAIKIEIIAGK